MHPRRRLLVLSAALAVAVLPQPGWTQASQPSADAERRYMAPESFSRLAKETTPAVVNISTTQKAPRRAMRGAPPGQPGPLDDLLREFFGGQLPEAPPRDLTALGSGFIVDPAGYVVTNNHVIADADEIKVVLQDDTELAAEVVGRDPRTDLALLKVEASRPLPAVEWGDSDRTEVGDWVLAIGNPFGLGGTVTAGIISARARDIQAGPYDDFLQTDAAINRGNSGGPLIDMEGQVVGVNTAIFSPTGGNIGIGFAVPSKIARWVVDELRATGQVRRGWLGVSLQPIDDELAGALGLGGAQGALVSEVSEGSPADKAGLRSGDVIVGFGGESIEDARELARVVANAPVGQPAEISILRDGERKTLSVRIEQLSEPLGQVAGDGAGEQRGKLGLTLAPATPELRERFGLDPETEGVIVMDVAEGSPAAASRLAQGDVIVRVGSQKVTTPAEVAEAVERAREKRQGSVALLRERDGRRAYVALPLEADRG